MDVIWEASSGDTYQGVTAQATTGLHVIIAKIDEAGDVVSLSIDGAITSAAVVSGICSSSFSNGGAATSH